MSTPPARVREAQEILDLAGTSLGPSDWVDVTQERVDAFARSVDDWRWVHNDPRRAALGPFGRTIGHAHLTEDDGAEATIRAWAEQIVNVHVEGMRKPAHDHLVPWEGDLDVRSALRVLRDVGYAGPATLELSRHSHDAARVARAAAEYLAPVVA